MDRIDLHTHSTASDGSMTPAELVRHAKASGLRAMALSDHDTVDGVDEAMAAGRESGIEVIPAIELSAVSATETHILGYFIDPHAPSLTSALDRIRAIRVERLTETCGMLRDHGIDVSIDEVRAIAGGGVLCRAHIARIMTDKGYAASPRDAFNRWLNVGYPCYSETQAITDEEAISLIRSAGGDAYLAHLHLTKLPDDELDAFVTRLASAGLSGIEGYYTDYTADMAEKYRALAKKYGLAISGGTDFHGSFKPHIAIGRGLGNMEIPYTVLAEMKKRHNDTHTRRENQ